MMSQTNACSYCMGSVVLISPRIYLYYSYFGGKCRPCVFEFMNGKIIKFCWYLSNHLTEEREKKQIRNFFCNICKVFKYPRAAFRSNNNSVIVGVKLPP